MNNTKTTYSGSICMIDEILFLKKYPKTNTADDEIINEIADVPITFTLFSTILINLKKAVSIP